MIAIIKEIQTNMQVRKRDGRVVDFEMTKIAKAIYGANVDAQRN
jgi:hypothetical protein